MHSCLLSSFSIFFFFGHRGCSKADRQWAHSCNLPATMPGEAPLEGLAADWIAPRDVISRQHPELHFLVFPAWLPAYPPQIKQQSCHMAAHSPCFFSLDSLCSLFLFTSIPLSFPHLQSLGCVPYGNYSFLGCQAVQPLWGRAADGRSDWLSACVYFLVVRMSDEIKHCSAAFVPISHRFTRHDKSIGQKKRCKTWNKCPTFLIYVLF